jgi:uncharacterized repeat protein (TIGR03803 family)
MFGNFSVRKLCGWKSVCAVFLLCAATAIAAAATTTFTTLVTFNGTNGASPDYESLTQGLDGNLYGVTPEGGAYGYGEVFKMSATGTLITLYSFCSLGLPCADGASPHGTLVQTSNGEFYGTTTAGGLGAGTVFKISPAGALSTLYSFCSTSGCADGYEPLAGLTLATNGNLYGMTALGGASELGTVFEITPAGILTTLHSFSGSDGDTPEDALVQGTDGNFYGTTTGYETTGAYGTVFKMTPAGAVTTLYTFCGGGYPCIDGAHPNAGLIQATNGSFYGVTLEGGANGFYFGTVFKITSAGALTTIYDFCAVTGCTDGSGPDEGLIQANDGNFYGTTGGGGTNCAPIGCGTAFKLTPVGTLTTLYSFCPVSGCADGKYPGGALNQATSGVFYGTALEGGNSANQGTVFSLSTGLLAFVETEPTSGKVGAKVTILGNNLTGSTAVTFNGTAATFKVVSSTEITVTVPTGATTGTVVVTTTKKMLKSNVPFRVTK